MLSTISRCSSRKIVRISRQQCLEVDLGQSVCLVAILDECADSEAKFLKSYSSSLLFFHYSVYLSSISRIKLHGCLPQLDLALKTSPSVSIGWLMTCNGLEGISFGSRRTKGEDVPHEYSKTSASSSYLTHLNLS